MSSAVLRNILDWDRFPAYDMLWTDPPWGEGMTKYFHTIAVKETGDDGLPYTSCKQILKKLLSLADVNKPLFIEYGTEYREPLTIAQNLGHRVNHVTKATQSRNDRPYAILSFNTDIEIPDGLIGGESVTYAIHALEANTVFDPFAGIGYTAKFVHKAGAEYVGGEFNEARYNKLVKVLEKHNAKK